MKYSTIISSVLVVATSLFSYAKDDIYSQSITATFDSPEDAQSATARILPLPENKKIAYSTRWDDTNTNHVNTARMLSERNMFASIYLVGGYFSAEHKRAFNEVLERGGSIGAHCLSHPHLGTLNFNDIFREVALERAFLESTFNTCVVGFVLPFVSNNSLLDSDVPRCIGLSIYHAGYRVNPEPRMKFKDRYGVSSPVYSSYTFGINDRNPQRSLLEKNINNARAKIKKGFEPYLTLGIHSWQNNEARVRLGQYIDEFKSDDFWYCNANQYVAYRTHALKGQVKKFAVNGNTATFELRRFPATNLGDDIPVSIEFSKKPKSVVLGGKEIQAKNGFYNIEHYENRKTPKKIDMIVFDKNKGGMLKSEKFKGLEFSLDFDRENARLSMKAGGSALEKTTGLRVRWVVPPCFAKPQDSVLYNGKTSATIKLKPNKTKGTERFAEAFAIGDMLVMAQCDFILEGKPVRVWLTYTDKCEIGETDCARDKSLHLGDFDASKNDTEVFKNFSKPETVLTDFADCKWQKKCEKRTREFIVSFDGFQLMQKYKKSEMSYLICADFDAPKTDSYKMYIDRNVAKVYINGEELGKVKSVMDVKMRAGKNRVLFMLDNASLKSKRLIFAVKNGDNFLKVSSPEVAK